jgi:type I restriction enzyme S subunit
VSRWPTVTIGEVADPVDRSEAPLPGVTYRQIGVRLWGEGAYERESMDGADTKYKTLNRVEAGDIIVNKIWARNGSVSVVTPALGGCFCSGEFPLFRPRPERLDPEWFYWITRTRWFWDACDRESCGTSGKNRLRPQRFLEITMPLPPIDEQRRVVEKLNRLAESVSKMTALQKVTAASSSVLSRSVANLMFASVQRESETMPLRELGAYITSGPRSWSRHYAESGDRFYRAQDIGPAGETVDEAKQYLVPPAGSEGRHARVAPGDVLVVITGATVGRVAMIGPLYDQGFVSQHVALCRVPKDVLLPEYLMCALLAPLGQDQLLASRYGQGKPGLNLASLLDLRVPRPVLDRQREVVRDISLQRKHDQRLKLRRRETSAEVEALLRVALSDAFL